MGDRLRMVEAAVALALAHVAVFWLPPWALSRLLAVRSGAADHRPAHLPAARQAAVAVRRACRRLPWENRCLSRAAALRLMLLRRGIPHSVRFGVRRQDGLFQAHAWLSVGPHTLIGGEEAAGFREIGRFGEDGSHAA